MKKSKKKKDEAVFPLRIPTELKKQIEDKAKHNRQSLNSFILLTLENSIGIKNVELKIK